MADRTLSKVVDDSPGQPSERREGTAETVMASPGAEQRRSMLESGDRPAFAASVGDHYDLREEVARGGMGRVIRAFDRRLGRVVAVKLLSDDTPGRRERFAREARITARLQHPSIVPIYEAGILDSGELAYAMKLVSGRDLQDAIDDTKTLEDRLPLLPRIIDVVDAIAYAHGQGVMHRDLKPSNIVLGEFGETIVIDWGVAKELDASPDPASDHAIEPGEPTSADLTRPGSVVGTPAYMSPEQAAAEPIDGRADVYALGAILSHVLTGKRPYADSANATAVLGRVVAGPPTPVEELEPHVPAELAAIVHRAMAREIGDRYTASELADELRRFTTGQLVAAHRYTFAERAVRWLRRHRGAVIVAAVATSLLVVGGVISARRILRERDAAEAASEREAARANDLLVARAASIAATNPTGAVGLLQQLPASAANWRAARDVLASARVRGVPWALPASQGTSGLVVARSGAVAFSSGNDGVVRRVDLVHGTSDVIFTGTGTTMLEFTADERQLVIADKSAALAWFDLATGHHQSQKLASPVDQMSTSRGDVVAWIDKAHTAWRLGPDRVPHQIDIGAARPEQVAVSPDGHYLALATKPAGAFVLDLHDDAAPVVHHDHTLTTAFAWSADSTRLAIASFRDLVEVDLSGTPASRTVRAEVVFAACYIADELYFSTAGAVFRDDAERGNLDQHVPHDTYASVSATRDAAVFSATSGTIAVVGRGGVFAIHAPTFPLFRAGASRDASVVALSTTDHLLRYDVAELLGHPHPEVPVGSMGSHGFLGNDRYFASNISGEWSAFDLATGSEHRLGKIGWARSMSPELSGAYLTVRLDTGDTVLARPDQPPVTLGTKILAVPVTRDRLELIDGLQLSDLAIGSLARTPAWTAPSPIKMAAQRDGVVAVATDHVVWRRATLDGPGTTIGLADPISAAAIAPDGSAFIATGTAIHHWLASGQLVDVATVPRAIVHFAIYDRVGLLVIDDTNTTWHVGTDGQPTTHPLPDGFQGMTLAPFAPLVVGFTNQGELQVYDLETRYGWSLGTGVSTIDVSPDGTHVATLRDDQLVVIDLDLPQDRDSYTRLLDATTNLRIGDTEGQIVWP